jgi:hypothetical protein
MSPQKELIGKTAKALPLCNNAFKKWVIKKRRCVAVKTLKLALMLPNPAQAVLPKMSLLRGERELCLA